MSGCGALSCWLGVSHDKESAWLRVTQTQPVGRKVENLPVYSGLVTLGSFIIIITIFIGTGLRF